MCNKQVDTESSTSSVYNDQLSSGTTTQQPCRPVNWQYVSIGGRQHGTLVQPPSQRVEAGSAGALCGMTDHPAAMSDGGNSRDSWSSTSSNVVVCQPVQPAVQPWSTYHCLPRQLTQYRGHVNQQQQHHLYDQAHHHTWPQVEISQSRCRQVYPQDQQHRQRCHCTSQRPPSGQPTQHQYLRSTSSVLPHHHHGTPCLPSACYPGMMNDMTVIQQAHAMQTNPPSQQISCQHNAPHSKPGSVWTGTQDQCIDGISSAQPLTTYSQHNTSKPTLATWNRVNDPDGIAKSAELQQQQQQQQNVNLLIHNSSNHIFSWSPDTSYDNGFINW